MVLSGHETGNGGYRQEPTYGLTRQRPTLLHYVLDEWFETVVKPRLKGEAYEIRFADDVILCFQYREDAEKVLDVLRKRFTTQTLGKRGESVFGRKPFWDALWRGHFFLFEKRSSPDYAESIGSKLLVIVFLAEVVRPPLADSPSEKITGPPSLTSPV